MGSILGRVKSNLSLGAAFLAVLVYVAGASYGRADADTIFLFDSSAIVGSTTNRVFLADEVVFTSLGTSTVTLTDTNDDGVIGPADDFFEIGVVFAASFKRGGEAVLGTGLQELYQLFGDFTLSGTAAVDGVGNLVATITGVSATILYDEALDNLVNGTETAIAQLTSPVGDCVITAASALSQGSCVIFFDFDAGGVTDAGVWTVGGIDLGDLNAVFRLDINIDEIIPLFALLYPGYNDTCGGASGGPLCAQVTALTHDGSSRVFISQVPVPGTALLIGAGLGFLALAGHLRRRSS